MTCGFVAPQSCQQKLSTLKYLFCTKFFEISFNGTWQRNCHDEDIFGDTFLDMKICNLMAFVVQHKTRGLWTP